MERDRLIPRILATVPERPCNEAARIRLIASRHADRAALSHRPAAPLRPAWTAIHVASHRTPIQRSVRPAELADAIRLSNGDPIPSRLSLYVLVPFSASACQACERNRVAAPTARSLSETYRR